MRSFGRVDLVVGETDAEEDDRRVEHAPERLLGTGAALAGEAARRVPDPLDDARRREHGRVVERRERGRDPADRGDVDLHAVGDVGGEPPVERRR